MKRVGDDTQGATFISGGDFGTSLDSLLRMYAMYRRGVHLDFLESIFDAFGITINRIHTAEAFVRACMSHIPPAINIGAYIEALKDVLLSIDLEYDDLDSPFLRRLKSTFLGFTAGFPVHLGATTKCTLIVAYQQM